MAQLAHRPSEICNLRFGFRPAAARLRFTPTRVGTISWEFYLPKDGSKPGEDGYEEKRNGYRINLNSRKNRVAQRHKQRSQSDPYMRDVTLHL